MRWIAAGLLVSAGFAGAALWTAREQRLHTPGPHAIDDVKARFRQAHRPSGIVDLRELPQADWADELIDPASALPQTHLHNPDELRALRRFEASCVDGRAGELAKAWRFAEARCAGAPLPDDFFARPPFMHPSGVSFARLAGTTHHAFMHHRELASLSLNGPLAFFARLSTAEALALVRGTPLVSTSEDLLWRLPSSEREEAARYERFPFMALLDGAERSGLTITPVTDPAKCLRVDGNLCWKSDEVGRHRRARLIAMLGGASGLSVCGVLLALWLQALGSRRRLQVSRALILKTLTHELRTPATGLTLSLEPLRADFDRLGAGAQDAFLRMCDDVNRIRRVLQASSRYLGTAGGLGVERTGIPSVRALLEEVLRPYDGCELNVERDGAFFTDAYWLGICVTNLVENAYAHGAPPVKVVLRVDDVLRLSVVDSGGGPAVPWRILRTGRAKSPESRGLGLGLHLVDTIVEALGGRLTMTRAPTTFSITLRKVP